MRLIIELKSRSTNLPKKRSGILGLQFKYRVDRSISYRKTPVNRFEHFNQMLSGSGQAVTSFWNWPLELAIKTARKRLIKIFETMTDTAESKWAIRGSPMERACTQCLDSLSLKIEACSLVHSGHTIHETLSLGRKVIHRGSLSLSSCLTDKLRRSNGSKEAMFNVPCSSWSVWALVTAISLVRLKKLDGHTSSPVYRAVG